MANSLFVNVRNHGSLFLLLRKPGNCQRHRFGSTGKLLISSFKSQRQNPRLKADMAAHRSSHIKSVYNIVSPRNSRNCRSLLSCLHTSLHTTASKEGLFWTWQAKAAVLAASGLAVFGVGFSWFVYHRSRRPNCNKSQPVAFNIGLFRNTVLCHATGQSVETDSAQTKSNFSGSSTVTLYQYQTCPFCCKVRAFLDYYGIPYEKVEVNPLFRKEIKFSDYRKVPIAIVDGVQLNDSSMIISVLRSRMIGKGTLEELLMCYPKIEDPKTKKIEYGNRNALMYGRAIDDKAELDAIKEERKWRQWVDDTFVHTLSPNIYRTMNESFQAFDYFSTVGNFGTFERASAQYFGAVAMYLLSKFVLKRRYRIKDNPRESLYDEAKKWTKAIGKKRKFMGGSKPNLADLAVYGVLSGIEGLDAFNDLMENTDIKPWYTRVRKAVRSHQGAPKYKKHIEEIQQP